MFIGIYLHLPKIFIVAIQRRLAGGIQSADGWSMGGGRGRGEISPLVMGISGEQERSFEWRCIGHTDASDPKRRYVLMADWGSMPKFATREGCNGRAVASPLPSVFGIQTHSLRYAASLSLANLLYSSLHTIVLKLRFWP